MVTEPRPNTAKSIAAKLVLLAAAGAFALTMGVRQTIRESLLPPRIPSMA